MKNYFTLIITLALIIFLTPGIFAQGQGGPGGIPPMQQSFSLTNAPATLANAIEAFENSEQGVQYQLTQVGNIYNISGSWAVNGGVEGGEALFFVLFHSPFHFMNFYAMFRPSGELVSWGIHWSTIP